MKSFSPQRRPDLEVREVEGELLILDRPRGRIHKFNASAAFIWQCCDGIHSREEIVDRVAARYAAPVDTVKRDVAATIEQFVGLGLLNTEVADKGE